MGAPLVLSASVRLVFPERSYLHDIESASRTVSRLGLRLSAITADSRYISCKAGVRHHEDGYIQTKHQKQVGRSSAALLRLR